MKNSGKSKLAPLLRIICSAAIVIGIAVKGVSNAWVILLAIMTVSMCLTKPIYLVVALIIGTALSVAGHVKNRHDEKKKGPAPGPDEIGG
jgi:F0F1-type ATP synthase assembly protein I